MVVDTRQVQEAMNPSSGGANNAPNKKKGEDFGLAPGPVPAKPPSNPLTKMQGGQAAIPAPATQVQPPQQTGTAQVNTRMNATNVVPGQQQQTPAPQIASSNTVGAVPNNTLITTTDPNVFGLGPSNGGGGGNGGGGRNESSYAYQVSTPVINLPTDNSRIAGALENSVINYLDNPNRYDNELVKEGMDNIRDRMQIVREDTMRGAQADIARTGMLSSSIGGQQLADTRRRVGQQENDENFRWGKTIADAYAQDRNASMQAATAARAQELQKYGIDAQLAAQQASMEMQAQRLSIESDLQDRALELQRRGMDEGMARFQAEMEFNERWNQKNYDLDYARFLGLEGYGGEDDVADVPVTPGGQPPGGGGVDIDSVSGPGGGGRTAQPRQVDEFDFGLDDDKLRQLSNPQILTQGNMDAPGIRALFDADSNRDKRFYD